MSTESTPVILDNSSKWEDWKLQFKAQVVFYNLVDQIFDNEAFLEKPIKPARPNYQTVPQTHSQTVQATVSSDTEPNTNTAAAAAAINTANAEL